MFCTCTRSLALDANIVRSRDAQCNTKELPMGHLAQVSTSDFA